MNRQGKIVRWDDKKGYGFIEEIPSRHIIFAHISAFHARNPRPETGEAVSFDIIPQADGKKVAQNIRRYRNGVEITDSAVSLAPPEKTENARPRAPAIFAQSLGNAFRNLIILVLLSGGAYLAYTHFVIGHSERDTPVEVRHFPRPGSKNPAQNFQCDGRTHCSQMRSCDEARYFLRHCPNTEMDGDNDGIPCEKQWCG